MRKEVALLLIRRAIAYLVHIHNTRHPDSLCALIVEIREILSEENI
jgi:hypothetical protein